jgi:CRP-like cAMP-binding protein
MSKLDVRELLKRSPFAPLGAEIDTLASLMVSKRVGRQEMVFWEGDLEARFFILGEGRLKAFRKLPEGKDITVFLLSKGDCFGFLPLLDGSPFPLSVEALEESVLLSLGRAEFSRFIKEHPDAALILLAHLAGRLRGCLDQVETIGRQGALARTAHGLMSLIPASEDAGAQPEAVLPFTQEEFAHILHLAPENLSRALARLQKEGAIRRLGKRRFRILSLQALRTTAG